MIQNRFDTISPIDNRFYGGDATLYKALAKKLNNAREHYSPEARYDTNGNPTRTTTEPLVDGGQFAPQSSGNGSGNVYINAKWQFNANAMYQAAYGIEVAGSVRLDGLTPVGDAEDLIAQLFEQGVHGNLVHLVVLCEKDSGCHGISIR